MATARATDPLDITKLCEDLQADKPRVRVESARKLSEAGPRAAEAIPSLVFALGDAERRVQGYAKGALVKLGELSVPALTVALRDPAKEVRMNAAEILWEIDVPRVSTRIELRRMADTDVDAECRDLAATILEEWDAGRNVAPKDESVEGQTEYETVRGRTANRSKKKPEKQQTAKKLVEDQTVTAKEGDTVIATPRFRPLPNLTVEQNNILEYVYAMSPEEQKSVAEFVENLSNLPKNYERAVEKLGKAHRGCRALVSQRFSDIFRQEIRRRLEEEPPHSEATEEIERKRRFQVWIVKQLEQFDFTFLNSHGHRAVMFVQHNPNGRGKYMLRSQIDETTEKVDLAAWAGVAESEELGVEEGKKGRPFEQGFSDLTIVPDEPRNERRSTVQGPKSFTQRRSSSPSRQRT